MRHQISTARCRSTDAIQKKSSCEISLELQQTNISSTFLGQSELLSFSPLLFFFFFPLERVQPTRELTVINQEVPTPEKPGRSVAWISPRRKHSVLSECPSLLPRAASLQSRVTSAQQWVSFTPERNSAPTLLTSWEVSEMSQSINRENQGQKKMLARKR